MWLSAIWPEILMHITQNGFEQRLRTTFLNYKTFVSLLVVVGRTANDVVLWQKYQHIPIKISRVWHTIPRFSLICQYVQIQNLIYQLWIDLHVWSQRTAGVISRSNAMAHESSSSPVNCWTINHLASNLIVNNIVTQYANLTASKYNAITTVIELSLVQ